MTAKILSFPQKQVAPQSKPKTNKASAAPEPKKKKFEKTLFLKKGWGTTYRLFVLDEIEGGIEKVSENTDKLVILKYAFDNYDITKTDFSFVV